MRSTALCLICSLVLGGFLMGCDSSAPQATPATEAPLPSSSTPILGPVAADGASGLSAEELALEPEAPIYEEPAVAYSEAARPLSLSIYSERGYEDADGRLVLDLLERDFAYLSAVIRDAEGRPVKGARPKIRSSGGSRIVPMAGAEDISDLAGLYAFGVAGGVMGAEDITISIGDTQRQILLNVISLRASGYPGLTEVEGALDWGLLVQAKFEWGEVLKAQFPEAIAKRDGEVVRLAGFMMPLEMREEQTHFVMTSNPPDCFFHIPGGPAGAVEVFARKAVPVSWDPVVLEGRFEALSESDSGVLYRLRDAKVIEP